MDNRKGGAMKELITEIVKALVDNPEEVSVTETGGSQKRYGEGHWQTGKDRTRNPHDIKRRFWKNSQKIHTRDS
jgi:hypothetical protein